MACVLSTLFYLFQEWLQFNYEEKKLISKWKSFINLKKVDAKYQSFHILSLTIPKCISLVQNVQLGQVNKEARELNSSIERQ